MKKLNKSLQQEVSRLEQISDDQIDTSDIPEIKDFSDAVRGLFYKPVKKQVTLRLDADLLAWFRGGEGKYQTQINAVLRQYMEAHKSG